jgi:type I restriction enzyme S subunit
MTGTSGRQRVQTDAIREYPLVRPPEPVLREFADLVGPHFGKIAANALQSQTLAATRDLLLPKLMSGEIRIREAERLVGEAV